LAQHVAELEAAHAEVPDIPESPALKALAKKVAEVKAAHAEAQSTSPQPPAVAQECTAPDTTLDLAREALFEGAQSGDLLSVLSGSGDPTSAGFLEGPAFRALVEKVGECTHAQASGVIEGPAFRALMAKVDELESMHPNVQASHIPHGPAFHALAQHVAELEAAHAEVPDIPESPALKALAKKVAEMKASHAEAQGTSPQPPAAAQDCTGLVGTVEFAKKKSGELKDMPAEQSAEYIEQLQQSDALKEQRINELLERVKQLEGEIAEPIPDSAP